MAIENEAYPATFDIDYPEKLNRLTSFFRIIWSLPALFILFVLSGNGTGDMINNSSSNSTAAYGSGIVFGLFAATALMILFRQRYPRWWFDFALELTRFSSRVGAYLFLLTDKYPSTVDKQSVHLDITYPDAEGDLNRWLPIVKLLLAIPHYVVLTILTIFAVVATIIAWFAILFTGRYPKSLFDFVVGVGRWDVRVNAYAFLLTTDKYPPFSLK
jgi:hypothetical protein